MNTDTLSSRCNISNLTAVIRNGSQYTARYEWTEETAVSYALPVYTNGNKSMAGRRVVSGNERKIKTAVKTAKQMEDVSISEQEARDLVELVKAYSIPHTRSAASREKWVLYIQEESQ